MAFTTDRDSFYSKSRDIIERGCVIGCKCDLCTEAKRIRSKIINIWATKNSMPDIYLLKYECDFVHAVLSLRIGINKIKDAYGRTIVIFNNGLFLSISDTYGYGWLANEKQVNTNEIQNELLGILDMLEKVEPVEV